MFAKSHRKSSKQMAVFGGNRPWLIIFAFLFGLTLVRIANGENIFLEWHVAIDSSIKPALADQPVSFDNLITLFPVSYVGTENFAVVIFE